jgi:protein phosphatase
MGCTLTAALLGPRGLVVAHVGDSRGYLLRGGELRRVTDDHTLVGRLVALGRITEEAARRHEQRHLLLEAVGGARDPDIDRRVLALAAGDRLLLCSDGLTDLVSDREIGDLLAGDGDPPAQCERLVELANGRGGVDNVTVVVVHLD